MMPDILIRGMDVPESCEECVTKHTFFRELKCADLPGMRNFGKNRLYTDSRNPHCPINKLPPHGDLVDTTQYRDEFMEGVYNMCADDSDNNRANAIIDLYDCAPVVVPAEKGETQ